ncbi:MAG TPA: sigma-70 family RNA polymerase sigma factor [Amnibacterium sp.]|uniref:RNA polymerase sigma factor n=1 Tax=Amnibacterium sp. TaxID=1872496 RepID=UPI002F94B950
MSEDVDAAIRTVFRAEWGKVVAGLIRITGDWALAEDCVQDAFAAAARRWPLDGVPASPGAWLTTTARNRALDRLRRSAVEARKLEEVLAMQHDPEPAAEIEDDRLRLVFTCCHPALPLEARVALTLRTLCGLTVAEIGRAFGASEAAMAKRLVRARAKIDHAGIPYVVPEADALPERLTGVLAVLYLLFTEGYAPHEGEEVVRPPLSEEAIRLTRLVAALLPREPEVRGLLALELLHDARRPARTGADGVPVPLDEQDRSRWDRERIAEGSALLAALDPASDGPYTLQARIAFEHDRAPADALTDRAAIAALYGRLARLTPSPFVELARAVAVSLADGPDAGLALLAPLERDRRLGYQLAATRADLLRRAGRDAAARAAYDEALAAVSNAAERAFLERRRAELG